MYWNILQSRRIWIFESRQFEIYFFCYGSMYETKFVLVTGLRCWWQVSGCHKLQTLNQLEFPTSLQPNYSPKNIRNQNQFFRNRRKISFSKNLTADFKWTNDTWWKPSCAEIESSSSTTPGSFIFFGLFEPPPQHPQQPPGCSSSSSSKGIVNMIKSDESS